MSYSGASRRDNVKEFPANNNLRVPPHSTEAEESVLGGILLDNQAMNVAAEMLIAEDFYRAHHRLVFEAMLALNEKNEPIDVVTLPERLKAMGKFEESGGLDNIAKLSSAVPSAANVAFYAKLIKGMALRRRLIHESSEIITEAYEAEGDIDELLDRSEARILSASEQKAKHSYHKISEVIPVAVSMIEQLCDRKEPITGVATGYKHLDHLTAGFQPSDLIIIAARPSMGKTSLAMCMAQYVGVHCKKPVAIFSLEMSKEQIALRMLASEARVSFSKVRTGQLGDRDFPKLVDAAAMINDAPIYIDDTPALTTTEIRAKARRLHRENKLSLVVVDYLQLMRSPSKDKREQEISDISRSLKGIAKELGVPVIALSQLNRSVESRPDKRPMMSDLRESGAIEQDADIIAFIYRDEFYNSDSPDKGIAEVIIAKQRNGPTGVVRLAFAPEFTRFDQLEETHDITAEPSEPSPQSPAANESEWEEEPF